MHLDELFITKVITGANFNIFEITTLNTDPFTVISAVLSLFFSTTIHSTLSRSSNNFSPSLVDFSLLLEISNDALQSDLSFSDFDSD